MCGTEYLGQVGLKILSYSLVKESRSPEAILTSGKNWHVQRSVLKVPNCKVFLELLTDDLEKIKFNFLIGPGR